jgi:hypothetical protein
MSADKPVAWISRITNWSRCSVALVPAGLRSVPLWYLNVQLCRIG